LSLILPIFLTENPFFFSHVHMNNDPPARNCSKWLSIDWTPQKTVLDLQPCYKPFLQAIHTRMVRPGYHTEHRRAQLRVRQLLVACHEGHGQCLVPVKVSTKMRISVVKIWF
jgi:hypothetical protein